MAGTGFAEKSLRQHCIKIFDKQQRLYCQILFIHKMVFNCDPPTKSIQSLFQCLEIPKVDEQKAHQAEKDGECLIGFQHHILSLFIQTPFENIF